MIWDKFKGFDRKKCFLEYTNQSLETLKQLPKERLFELQKAYYKMKLEKVTEFLFNYSPRDRNETVTYESQKRHVDNSFQFDRIMKSSKPSSPTAPKLLNGTVYFKQKGNFEQLYIEMGTKNNCPKPTFPLWPFYT